MKQVIFLLFFLFTAFNASAQSAGGAIKREPFNVGAKRAATKANRQQQKHTQTFHSKGAKTNERTNAISLNTREALNEIIDEMVFIEGGTYLKGDPTGEWTDYQTEKSVQSFYISKFLITQRLWKLVMGNNPSNKKGENYPVERVSFNDCQTFIAKLNKLSGKNFRLPTDDEWEYAAGGCIKDGIPLCAAADVSNIAWKDEDSHEVGLKAPNELGLYDMLGNIGEWVIGSSSFKDNGYGIFSIIRGEFSIYGNHVTRLNTFRDKRTGFRLAITTK